MFVELTVGESEVLDYEDDEEVRTWEELGK